MRITNNIIQQGSLTTIQDNLKRIHAAQVRIATGLKIQKASDDPVGAGESMRARGTLRALDQYRRGIQTATRRADAEENALDQLTSILIRARELATAYGSDSSDAVGRRAGQIEVEGLLRQAISIANSRVDDGYLFGGLDAATRPYDVDESGPALGFTTVSPTGEFSVEISERQRVMVNHSGTTVFEDTGLLASIRDLAVAMGNNDAEGIRAVMPDVDRAFAGVQTLLGEVGSRANLLQVTTSNLDALELNLLTLKSEIEEVDIEKAMMELVGRQTSFQAALLSTSQLMNLTLTNYLR